MSKDVLPAVLMKEAKTAFFIAEVIEKAEGDCDEKKLPIAMFHSLGNRVWLPVSAVTEWQQEFCDTDKITQAVTVALYKVGLLKEVPSRYESVIYDAVREVLEVKP